MSDELTAGGVDSDSSVPSSDQVVTDSDGEVVSTSPDVSGGEVSGGGDEWQGVRDYARGVGVELPYSDDQQALAALLANYQQRQQPNFYEQFGRQVAPYADRVSEWLRQEREKEAVPKSAPAWQPPDWNPSWVNLVDRDPATGAIVAKPGVNPAIAEKVQAYIDWQDKFREDPAGVIKPLVESRARELIQQEFATHRQTVEADNLVAQNASWMFQVDAAGNPMLHPDGSRVLSPAGTIYARSVHEIGLAGVRDVRQMHAMAMSQVENAVLRQRWLTEQQKAPASRQAQVQGQMPVNVGGSATRHEPTVARTPQSKKGMSLREQLNASLAGFGDDDVM